MARPPENDYPDEIESDREIKPLTSAGSRLPTLFIMIAGAVGLFVLVTMQLFGGNSNEPVQTVQREVFVPPVDTSAPLPRPQVIVQEPEPEPEPVQVVQNDKTNETLNILEIERLRQMALLEEQKLQLVEAQQRAAKLERDRRLKSPLILVDNGGTAPTTEDNSGFSGFDNSDLNGFNRDQDPNERNEIITNENERFLRDAGAEQVVKARAVRLANQDFLLTQGTFITGVTETMINSDLPGFTRAIVDKDVYGRTGKLILVPKGSRLIGRYQSGVDTGQSRVYIVWTRLERPDGVVINIGSPGTDRIGQGGLTGNVDTHFFERFGASTLFSALGPATAALLDNGDQSANTQQIIEGGRQGFNRSAEIILQDSIDIAPTIRVPQGSEITIFVNKDLSFDAIQN